MRLARRSGLSLVEVLVVLVLGLVALGLVMAFLQRFGEKSRQTQCANNLRILGESFHSFEGNPESLKEANLKLKPRGKGHQTLPPARLADGFATWAVFLAPYLVNESPLQRWELMQPYWAQPDDVRQATLPVFFCPARVRPGQLSLAGDLSPKTHDHLAGGLGDYACAAGDGSALVPAAIQSKWGFANFLRGWGSNGALLQAEIDSDPAAVIAWKGRTTFADLKRGQQYTVLLGEKHVPLDQLGLAAAGDGSLYNGAHPAGYSRVGGPGFGLAPSPTAGFNNNFGSAHPGLCQFLMADTSVWVLTTSVNETVLGERMARD